jgi:cell division protein ZapA (FtsZ GTPase activity inhibitor)
MNEKVEVLIGSRRLVVEMEGLTPLEINGLAEKVAERMRDVQGANKNVADSSKLALLVALTFAAELDKERSAHRTTQQLLENKAESLSRSLRESLQAGSPPAEAP